MKNKKNLSLYLHIPFCIQKCEYCDFLSFSASEEDRNSYVRELKKEIAWKGRLAEEYRVISVFFGGGTPSLLSEDEMSSLLEEIYRSYDVSSHVEITTEANPGTLTKKKLSIYRKAGINRLSIGLQSTDDRELAMLGRIHTYDEFLKSFYDAREAGFENINIDLMSALPGQTLESYQQTLCRVVSLDPEHISAYSLIVEDGTPLAKNRELLKKIPDEDLDRAMYQLTKEYLHQYGYERYEISNYAKDGKECIHNIVYWTGGAYLGLGLGASSYFEGERYCNEEELKKYHFQSEKKQLQILSEKDGMEEFMFLGMRMTKGISKKEFFHRFHKTIDSVYGDILKKQEEEQLIRCGNDRICLTEKGLDISNYVFCDYLF